jgi:cytochrome c peroxidase
MIRQTSVFLPLLGLMATLAFAPASHAEDLSMWELPAVPVPADNPQTAA